MKLNIALSFVIKFAGVGINFLFVPLTIKYINTERYGIWLTVSSIISWFSLLDIGFGNGLRNKFGLAADDVPTQRRLVQTTLFVLVLISSGIVLIYFGLFNNLHWDSALGVSVSYRAELQKLFAWIIAMFAFQFVFQVITPILYALQKPSMVALNTLLGNFFGLMGILALRHFSTPSLFSLGVVVMGGNLLAYFLFFGYYFFIQRRDLLSNFHIPGKGNINSIFSLGFKFFVVNVAYVVQYQSSNFLISRNFTPEKVTEFNIAYKLFGVTNIVFGIIVSPLWSSVTNAMAGNDFIWIEKIVKKLMMVWGLVTACCLVVLMLSPHIYRLWVGDKVSVSFIISLGVVLVVSTNSFSAIFIQTLNGLSVVNLQFWLSIFVIIIFVPLAYFLSVNMGLGVFGICIATVISNVNGILVAPLQLMRVIGKMKTPEKKEFAIVG